MQRHIRKERQELRCQLCGEMYPHNPERDGELGTDMITICGTCYASRPIEARRIHMGNFQYWQGCSIGAALGICSTCAYNDICDRQDKQTKDYRGVDGI